MRPAGPEPPLQRALLRVTAFAVVVEAVCVRLLPRSDGPALARAPEWVATIRESSAQAGATAFVVAMALCLVLLMGQSAGALGRRPGGAWTNGLLAGCLMALITTSLSAALLPVGPAFVAGFTLLSLLIVLLVIGQSYPDLDTGWQRGFAICCGALSVCSAVSQLALVSSGGRAWAERLVAPLGGPSGTAGFLLAAAAGALSYMAWMESPAAGTNDAPVQRGFEGTLSGAGALAFAAICIFPVRGGEASALPERWPAVALASASLFLAGATALSAIMTPGRARVGYGLLLMILAGFPLRTVLQNLLMVLGCLLVFAVAAPEPPAAAPGGSETGAA